MTLEKLRSKTDQYSEVGRRIVSEFWFPLLCAFGWMWFVNKDAWNVKAAFQSFGTSFVMVSWTTGQIFRIAKQSRVDKNLNTIENRLIELVGRLEKHTKDFMGYSIGENGFACFRPMIFAGTNRVEFRLLNDSEYPVFDIVSELIDLDEKIYPEQGKFWTRNRSFMTSLYPKKITDPIYVFEMKDREWIRINIFVQTRSGGCIQQFRIGRMSDGQILIASATDKPDGPVFNIPLNFPGYEAGKEKELFQ